LDDLNITVLTKNAGANLAFFVLTIRADGSIGSDAAAIAINK